MKNAHVFQKITKQLLGLIAVLLLLPWSFCIGQGTWAPLNNMPVIKNHQSSITYNGKIYLFGGGVDANYCTDEVWEYDPEEDSYTAKAPIPRDVCYPAVAAYNGKIYLFGGYDIFGGLVTNLVFEYDVANDSWQQKESMSAVRGIASACLLNDKIYVIGGATSAGNGLTSVEIYDPVTNTWSSGPAMPVARGGMASFVVNGKIYMAGGASSLVTPPLTEVAVFDPETGIWSTVSPMPTPRIVFAAAEVGGKIFVTGGYIHVPPSAVLTSVQMYDPVSDEWNIAVTPMPVARRGHSASAHSGKIYIFGGNNTIIGFMNTAVVFDPGNLVPVIDRVVPKGVMLAQNAPNPFCDATDISFTVTISGYVNLSLIDMSGHVLQTLISENLTPGTYDYFLDARNLDPGTYFYRLQVDGDTPEVRKMVVVK